MDVSHCKSQLPRLKEEAGALKVVTPVSLVPVKSVFSEQPTECTDQGTAKGMLGEGKSTVTMSWACACSALEKELLLSLWGCTFVYRLLCCFCTVIGRNFGPAPRGFFRHTKPGAHVAVCSSVSLWCWRRHLSLWNRPSEGSLLA